MGLRRRRDPRPALTLPAAIPQQARPVRLQVLQDQQDNASGGGAPAPGPRPRPRARVVCGWPGSCHPVCRQPGHITGLLLKAIGAAALHRQSQQLRQSASTVRGPLQEHHALTIGPRARRRPRLVPIEAYREQGQVERLCCPACLLPMAPRLVV